jgi:hypothetical protein
MRRASWSTKARNRSTKSSVPDEKQFVVVLSGQDGADPRVQKATQMIAVEHWFEELKRLAPTE